jgi:hypothetical protein
MTAFRLFLTVLAMTLAGGVCAQTGERGSIPPGQSRDGSAPGDGAIKGGAILPGETGGVPKKKHCEELSGSLREDCLKQEREAASGETKHPSDIRKRSPEPAD